MINYEFFAGSPRLFNNIFEFNFREFEALIPQIEREFNKRITSKYKRPRRFRKLAIKSPTIMRSIMYR
jgi:hypothetical protein